MDSEQYVYDPYVYGNQRIKAVYLYETNRFKKRALYYDSEEEEEIKQLREQQFMNTEENVEAKTILRNYIHHSKHLKDEDKIPLKRLEYPDEVKEPLSKIT